MFLILQLPVSEAYMAHIPDLRVFVGVGDNKDKGNGQIVERWVWYLICTEFEHGMSE